MRELHLFAGAGGGVLGGILLGHTPVCAVEILPWSRKSLLQRQRDGVLPRFPIWDDVKTFDGKPWRGKVDCICGGFPCQDISCAGEGKGIDGERSGLWGEFARIIGEVMPEYVFVENSPLLVKRGLTRVIRNLAQIGYDAVWTILGADNVGAPHKRKRIWILARRKATESGWVWQRTCCSHTGTKARLESCRAGSEVPNPDCKWNVWRDRWTENVGEGYEVGCDIPEGIHGADAGAWWETEPRVGRVVDGLGVRMEFDEPDQRKLVPWVATVNQSRVHAIGNGQVPLVAAVAFKTLYETINKERKNK